MQLTLCKRLFAGLSVQVILRNLLLCNLVCADDSAQVSPRAPSGRTLCYLAFGKKRLAKLAVGQNPNRTPGEHPNPTTKKGSRMGSELTYQPKWDYIGFDNHSHFCFSPWTTRLQAAARSGSVPSRPRRRCGGPLRHLPSPHTLG